MCRLLTQAEIEDEESLECLCILLSTVGQAVEYRVEMKEFPAISVGQYTFLILLSD